MRKNVGSRLMRAAVIRALALVVILAALLTALYPAAATASPRDSRDTLYRYARDTWASLVAMTDPETGLPADSLSVDGVQSVETSTTNIGAYMWSTVVAERLGIIGHGEAVARLSQTLTTLARME